MDNGRLLDLGATGLIKYLARTKTRTTNMSEVKNSAVCPTLKIRDLDYLIQVEEINEALKNAVGKPGGRKVKVLRPN